MARQKRDKAFESDDQKEKIKASRAMTRKKKDIGFDSDDQTEKRQWLRGPERRDEGFVCEPLRYRR
jgi:hypothetical protein